MTMRRGLLCLGLLLLWVSAAQAQLASLVADKVEIQSSTTIVAEGNVEMSFDGTRLIATRVTYDSSIDKLQIEGPLTIIDSAGNSVLLASSAEIDPAFRDGALKSARFVLDQHLQLAANEIVRVDGRYTQMTKTIASTCRVCDESQTPLWEVRGSRVIHDAEEKQLYFDDAQIRVLGVPVFYAPRLRLPDPSLKRSTGFLVPSLEFRSRLGTGIKIPYFIRLNETADLEFTPYLSQNTTTLETQYRREFTFGSLTIEGAVSQDDIRDGTRAFAFADAEFQLPNDFLLEADLWLVSDDEYLRDYNFTNTDRLESGLTFSRTRDNDDFEASATVFRTLRFSETAFTEELPDRLLDVNYTRRIFDDVDFGTIWATADASSLVRPSDTDGFGRDTQRISAALDWSNDWTLLNGMVASADLGVVGDITQVRQDSSFDAATQRLTPRAGIELRWPFSRTEAGGGQQLIEPVVQLAWAETYGDDTPNEDSTLVEFDEGNLFSLSRFPGFDAYEEGLRANTGVTWTRFDPEGWSVSATAGRVFRFSGPDDQFGADTGLDGEISDWLFAVQLNTSDQLSVTNRTIVTDSFDVSRSETRLGWRNDVATIASTYIWLAAEPTANQLTDSSEITFESTYKLNRHWTGAFDVRYETDTDRATFTGVGLTYENECLGVDLTLSRRFADASDVEPITEFGVSLFLPGFGSRQANNARSCHS